jgi:hypothetical protein
VDVLYTLGLEEYEKSHGIGARSRNAPTSSSPDQVRAERLGADRKRHPRRRPPCTPATQGSRCGDRAAASDAVSGAAHGSGCHGSLGVTAERAEVDLAVSGPKPDWPPRPRPVVSRRRALSAGSCRCSRSRGNGRSRRTPDVLQARRRTWVRTNQNGPADRGFSLERPTIGPGRVRSQSDPTQTHKPTAHAKKACKYRPFCPFSKRLKGFEPSTFCMASSRSAAPRRQKRLQIGVPGRLDRTLAFQELCADTGGLDNERIMSDADGGGLATRRPFGPRTALPASSVSRLPGRSR